MPVTNKTEEASAKFSKTVAETTERLEREAQEFIKYLNDDVVPSVRQHSTKALRTAAQKLQELANYMEHHSSSTK
jgi:hypothetical protein